MSVANREIYRRSRGESGTTLVMLHLSGARATLWWIGDSRAYLIRDGRLTLLTHDHSLVQRLVDAGLVKQSEAADHPQANVITRAVGIAAEAELDSRSFDLEPGDRILLCSDGLSRTIAEDDLGRDLSVGDQVEQLLANSLRRDGSDNTSLVLIEYS